MLIAKWLSHDICPRAVYNECGIIYFGQKKNTWRIKKKKTAENKPVPNNRNDLKPPVKKQSLLNLPCTVHDLMLALVTDIEANSYLPAIGKPSVPGIGAINRARKPTC